MNNPFNDFNKVHDFERAERISTRPNGSEPLFEAKTIHDAGNMMRGGAAGNEELAWIIAHMDTPELSEVLARKDGTVFVLTGAVSGDRVEAFTQKGEGENVVFKGTQLKLSDPWKENYRAVRKGAEEAKEAA